MNYLDITMEEMEIEKTLLNIYKKIYQKMPSGRLTTKRVNGNIFYYRVDTETQKATYIQKHNWRLILQLKQKRWLEESIKTIEGNLGIQQKVLNKYKDYRGKSIQDRLSKSYDDSLIDEYEKKYLLDEKEWTEMPYRKNPYHEENLRFETSFGLRVRSKSELFIAELLHQEEIPFHYDAEIRLQGKNGRWKNYYVDFVIMTPTREQILWEHLGLFGNETYRQGAFEKMTDYFLQGYFIPKNFIITMDGPDGEFDVAAIKRIIEGQILPLFKKR